MVCATYCVASESVLQANRATVTSFVRNLQFTNDEGHPDRTEIERHLVCRGVLLRAVLEELLILIRITGTVDSQRYTGLLLQLSKALEDNPDEACTVYCMSPVRRRERTIDDYGEVSYLFQGQAPVNPPERRGEVYPGDRAIRDDDAVTVQIHALDLTQVKGGNVIKEDVPVIAVWIPARPAGLDQSKSAGRNGVMSALDEIFNIITPARGDDPDKPIYYIITQIAAIQENLPNVSTLDFRKFHSLRTTSSHFPCYIMAELTAGWPTCCSIRSHDLSMRACPACGQRRRGRPGYRRPSRRTA